MRGQPKLREVLGDVLLPLALVIAWGAFIGGCGALLLMRFMPPPEFGWHRLALFGGVTVFIGGVTLAGVSAIKNWDDRRHGF